MTLAARPRFPALIWSHFSRPRFGGFDERIAAAAAAGMTGVGLYVFEYERLRVEEGRSADDIRAVLDRHQVTIAEAEVARGWWAESGPIADEAARIERWAFEMADEFGTGYLQTIGPYDCPFEQAVDGLGRLCDRAASHGIRIGIEWLPFTNIATPADAQRLVEAVGRDNAGYCADIWHHRRGVNDEAMLDALDIDRIFSIQMSDGAEDAPPGSDYKADCLANRLVPGAGAFDAVGFIRRLADRGVTAPIALEVCSSELWEADPTLAATAAADAMRAVLVEAGVA